MQLSDIYHALALPFSGRDMEIKGFKIDSREIEPNDVFIAFRGNRLDGHDYINMAVKKGAIATVVEKPVTTTIRTIEVGDSIRALGKMAAYWRCQLALRVVGITGSCGKTTVKHMLASILQQTYCDKDYFISPGNYNSITGVPLSLLQLQPSHRLAVIEIAMNRFNEIATTSRYAKLDVAAINNATPAHLEGVGDIKGVALAKGEIFQGLAADGIAILNADSDFYHYWRQLLMPRQRVITFGQTNDADIQLKQVKSDFRSCRFNLTIVDHTLSIRLPLAGKHQALNATCAAAIAHALAIDNVSIQQGLAQLQARAGRFQSLPGVKHSIIIDDSYNASPASVKAAIDILQKFAGRKILLLGAMRELGEKAHQYHSNIGYYAKKQGVDYLFAIGDIALAVVDTFGKGGYYFTKRCDLLHCLLPLIDKNTCVVVKGSFSMNMKTFVEKLRR